jgi:hypothetical protein
MSERYWKSISDMPLFNWRKCIGGELVYIRVETSLNAIENAKDEFYWTLLFDEYIKRYGLGKIYKKWIDLAAKKSILESDFVLTRNKFRLTEIEIQEAKIKSMLENKGEGTSIEKSLIHLSKWMGYRLNEKEVTVKEFFDLMEEYGKANKTK